MKRFSKILVAVAALCLLVGVLALAISANYTGATGKFVVNGQGYDTWEGEDGALAAANNTHTIYLNEDWTLDTGLTLSGATTNVKINLNGKTVTVKDGTPWFTVTTSAKLTVEGEGTLNNSGQMFIVARNTGTNVTVNATGKGITINNSSTIANVYTFFFTTGSTLNVSGKMVVNTTAVQASGGSRTIFYVYDKNKNSVKLNINDAYILYATPTVTGAPQGKVIYSGYSNISINNSKLEGIYSNIIYSVTKDSTTDGDGTVKIGSYLQDLNSGSGMDIIWNPNTIAAAKKEIDIAIAEHITATNSVFYSDRGTGYTSNVTGNVMYLTGATEGVFADCEFYGSYLFIASSSGSSYSNSNLASAYTHSSQLTFNDCHFRDASLAGNSTRYIFYYAPNFKVNGGSFAFGNGVTYLANGHPHYIELDNGEWLGGYVDNVLGISGLTGSETTLTGSWVNTTVWNPDSTIVSDLPESVTIVVGGEEKTFTTGYFSDESIYESYKSGPSAEPSGGIVVDGVGYATDAEAMAAIQDGSVVEFNRDMKDIFDVDAIIARLGVESVSFKILPGEFSFPGVVSKTHKLVDYTGAFGGYLVTPAGFGEVYKVYYYDEMFGLSGTVDSVAEGTLYYVGDLTKEGEETAYNGKLWSINSWVDKSRSATANGLYSNSEFLINVSPDYKTETYYYEITVNDTSKYITDSALGGGISEALAVGDVKIVLWQDVVASAVSIKGNLEIDLNGCSLTAVIGEEHNLFNLLPGTKLNICSSREGAAIEASDAKVLFNAEYDRRRSGDVEISLSDVDVRAQGLVNYCDTYVHDPATGEDVYEYSKKLVLNASNVALSSSASSGALITTTLPLIVNAQGFDYEGHTTLINSFPDERATLAASFKDSSFKAPVSLVNAPGKNRSVYFEQCYIGAPLAASYETVEEEVVYGGELISIGKDCSFTEDVETVSKAGLVFEAGCIAVPANASDVKTYVNVPEVMAIVSWIGADGNPIAEPNYNAPFGKPAEQFTWEEANEKVGLYEENTWYFVSFDNWDISDDYELTSGSVNVYPKWKAPKASIKCLKLDLVAYTYFKLNLYLPEDAPEGVELYGIYREADDGLDHSRDPRYKLIDGKWYELLVTGETVIGGEKYNSYSAYPGAADASEPEYKIAFDLNGELLVDTVYCGVPTYAETAMNDIMKDVEEFDDLSENDKILAKLVMNMVRYANESYKLAKGASVGASKYEALLATYSSLLVDLDSIEFTEKELDVDTSKLGAYMEGVSFVFGAYQPRFVFKYKTEVLNSLVKPETTDGKIYSWPEGNRGLFAVIYHENYDGTKSLSYIASHLAYNGKDYVAPDVVTGAWGPMSEAYAATVDMNVYNATGVINVELYSPEGKVVRGSYSLAAYIDYITKTVNEAKAKAIEAGAIALDAAMRAELASAEAAKPENAPLREKYEALAAENEAIAIKNEAIKLENEDIAREYSSFLEASLSLYAFSLASQEYGRVLVGE